MTGGRFQLFFALKYKRMHVFFFRCCSKKFDTDVSRALGGFGDFVGTFLLGLFLKYDPLKIHILKYRRMHTFFHFYFLGGSIFINVHISSSRARFELVT